MPGSTSMFLRRGSPFSGTGTTTFSRRSPSSGQPDRIWARHLRDDMHAQDEKSWLMRFHTQTAGSTLTAQQPLNNVARTTLQALAAVLGGTQSLHTNSFDEALGLPTDESALVALRTQQVIAYESGVANTVDPLAGSYFVEELTNQLEEKAEDLLSTIAAMGGAVAAIEEGWMQAQIEDSAYREAKRQNSGESTVVWGESLLGWPR